MVLLPVRKLALFSVLELNISVTGSRVGMSWKKCGLLIIVVQSMPCQRLTASAADWAYPALRVCLQRVPSTLVCLIAHSRPCIEAVGGLKRWVFSHQCKVLSLLQSTVAWLQVGNTRWFALVVCHQEFWNAHIFVFVFKNWWQVLVWTWRHGNRRK